MEVGTVIILIALGFAVLLLLTVAIRLALLAACGLAVFSWVAIFTGSASGPLWISAVASTGVFFLLCALTASNTSRD